MVLENMSNIAPEQKKKKDVIKNEQATKRGKPIYE